MYYYALLYLNCCSSSSSVSKALQEFDLALRGKKKRNQFVMDSKKKKDLTVRQMFSVEGSVQLLWD